MEAMVGAKFPAFHNFLIIMSAPSGYSKHCMLISQNTSWHFKIESWSWWTSFGKNILGAFLFIHTDSEECQKYKWQRWSGVRKASAPLQWAQFAMVPLVWHKTFAEFSHTELKAGFVIVALILLSDLLTSISTSSWHIVIILTKWLPWWPRWLLPVLIQSLLVGDGPSHRCPIFLYYLPCITVNLSFFYLVS